MKNMYTTFFQAYTTMLKEAFIATSWIYPSAVSCRRSRANPRARSSSYVRPARSFVTTSRVWRTISSTGCGLLRV
jgi:hypothetical protein